MSEQGKKAELLERKLNATKRKLSALQSFSLEKLHVQPDQELYQKGLVDPLIHYEFEILKKRNNEMICKISTLQQQQTSKSNYELTEKNRKLQDEVELLKSELKNSTNNLQDANSFIASLKEELITSYKKAKFFELENSQLHSKLFYYQTQQSTSIVLPINEVPVDNNPSQAETHNDDTHTNFNNFLSSFDKEPEPVGGNMPPVKDEPSDMYDPEIDAEQIDDETMNHQQGLTESSKTMDSWAGTLLDDQSDNQSMDSPKLEYEEY